MQNEVRGAKWPDRCTLQTFRTQAASLRFVTPSDRQP